MQTHGWPTPRTWPALAAALLYGLVEWTALCRSRAADAMDDARRARQAIKRE
jgi:hypothetical protein